MKRLSLLLLLFCQFGFSQNPETLSFDWPERPNILWLVAEDLGPYIPSFGDSTIQTPHLSRLAAEGICYDNVYSPSPVCAPSRAALALGMYPTHVAAGHMRTGPWYMNDIPEHLVNQYRQYMPEGVFAYEAMPPAGAKMMSETLREAGYYCTNNSKMDYQFQSPYTAWDESNNKAHWRNREAGQPFFAIFNFGVTHESRIWAKAKDSLWVDENLDIPVPPYLPDTKIGRQDVRRMYSNIREMDYQVGQILAELEKDGLLENTIIFWYTDHGGPLPRQKRLLYDSGLKVPMIIRFPQQQNAGKRDDQLISFIDFGPTVFSLVGLETPSHMDGQAFLGPFQKSPRPYIHAAADRFDAQYDTNRAIRDKRFKYIKYYQTNKPMFLPVAYREQMAIMQELHRLDSLEQLTPAQQLWFRETKPEEELFDTAADPHEINNLAADPAYQEKLEELRAELDRWLGTFDDTGMKSEKELIAELWPEGKQPVTANPVLQEGVEVVSLSCATEGASIGYKIVEQGKEEPTSWMVYKSKAINIKSGQKLKVVAQRIGYKRSQIVEKEY